MSWKIPYYAESTAAVIRHNWLLKVMGPNYTAEEVGDVDRDDVPSWMKRRDQEDNPKGWRE
ncbi:MAG: hypothetical protein AVDCRST_MAG93-1698 [uncultured Chloroflexia bacterium]|uniref:Uncharacterized protein n=1 Tax=uncultured Chloroflexia bacterium TaxID=1672391 RepID=A0A6J4IEJ0_9CHLR|nr:MAG: hypothetical protein AVDCRST_MAG93-1698 [uncultured Chloroflexia bacterium]